VEKHKMKVMLAWPHADSDRLNQPPHIFLHPSLSSSMFY